MTAFWMALLSMGASDTAARFEADGVRVAESLVRGTAFEVKRSAGGSLLVSGSAVEPLTAEVRVTVEGERTVILDPGVRIARSEGGYVLSGHGVRVLRVQSRGRSRFIASPAPLRAIEGGWEVGRERIEGAALVVRAPVTPLPQQTQPKQDPDKELNELKEAARQAEEALKKQEEEAKAGRKLRSRRVFQGDPSATGDSLDFRTLTGLPQASPVGP